jgi:coiled-coil domain-containing protein 130
MQGFNMGRYVPPEHEGVTSGNALHRKRPPGIRANGQQVVRFEMPFPIWCDHCPKPTIIGQGVRFNATKTRVGSYYSSPIFSFRIKHTACSGEIEIRTDPKNTAYLVVSGARKRDLGTDAESLVKSGDGLILTAEEKKDLREAAFKNLEKTIEDRTVAEAGKERIEELQRTQSEVWDDPYERNRRLRAQFRVGRKEREKEAEKGEEIKGRLGLDEEFLLLPAKEEDALRAGLVDFGSLDEDLADGQGRRDKALSKPLFGGTATSPTPKTRTSSVEGKEGKEKKKAKVTKKLKSELATEKMRETLVSEIIGNTRASRDPFLDFGSGSSTRSLAPRIPGLKRKRAAGDKTDATAEGSTMAEVEANRPMRLSASLGLVNYDSD